LSNYEYDMISLLWDFFSHKSRILESFLKINDNQNLTEHIPKWQMLERPSMWNGLKITVSFLFWWTEH